MTATPDEIEAKAQELHLARALEEQRGHRQNIVPWSRLGESFRASMRRIAKAQLDEADKAMTIGEGTVG